MNTALSDTIFYVTGKQGIENATQFELETMIAEYPYFAPAQLVYATKLKSENSFKLQTQTQKAGLFFNNFKWLQYQLMEIGANNFKTFYSKDYATVAEQIIVSPVVEETASAVIEPIAKNDKVVEFKSTTTEAKDILAVEATSTSINEFMPNMLIPSMEDVKDIMNGIDDRREIAVEELAATATEEVTTIIEEVAASPIDIQESVNEIEENNIDTIAEDVEEKSINIEAETSVEETISNHIAIAREDLVDTVTTTDAKPDIHAEIAALKANWYSHNQEVIAEPKIEIEEVKEEPVEEVQNFPGVNADLANFKNEWAKPTETLATQPLPFETEPYYTIDYFASQGIKFDYSKEPHDRLTTKMLRFTDWLKKMKTVKPEQEVTMSDDPELDNAIQNIASISNQSREIVTETMAEIFAKQGKTEKAIQLYIKLSFLIPDKSAYFATQIKELKGI
jgi:hypothetical protein